MFSLRGKSKSRQRKNSKRQKFEQSKGSQPPKPKLKFAWSEGDLGTRKMRMEQRREEIVNLDITELSNEEIQEIVQELRLLQEARDSLLQIDIKSEAMHHKNEQMTELLSTFKNFRNMSFEAEEKALRNALHAAAQHVHHYCKDHELGPYKKEVPVPVPAPPPLPMPKMNAKPKAKARPKHNIDSNLALGSQANKNSATATPLRVSNVQLLKDINKSQKLLKRIEKSPGGTPMRQKSRKLRREDCKSHTDFLLYAFQNKYKNISTWRSPQADSPSAATPPPQGRLIENQQEQQKQPQTQQQRLTCTPIHVNRSIQNSEESVGEKWVTRTEESSPKPSTSPSFVADSTPISKHATTPLRSSRVRELSSTTTTATTAPPPTTTSTTQPTVSQFESLPHSPLTPQHPKTIRC